MRAMTVKQPWASLIASGDKDIENRSWRTSYRGPLVITASKVIDRTARIVAKAVDSPTGVVVGVVDLIDCVQGHPSPWAMPDCWHWVLAKPRRCTPIAVKGSLGLWNIGDDKVVLR